jgi:glutathione S-transferase
MKLYVCYSALKNVRTTGRPGGHPCGNAHVALKEAGYEPEVVAVGGLGFVPLLNKTAGRNEVRELTGSPMVPVLVKDDGEVITESKAIVAWAEANPAGATA